MKMEDVKVGMKLKHMTTKFLPDVTVTKITERGFEYCYDKPFSAENGVAFGGECWDCGYYEPVEGEYEPTPQDLAWLSANHILSEVNEFRSKYLDKAEEGLSLSKEIKQSLLEAAGILNIIIQDSLYYD